MNVNEARVGTRVRTLVDFVDVPSGTEGVVDQDYGSGVMIAWDLPNRPLAPGYREWDGTPAWACTCPLRDGFSKTSELHFLEVVKK